MKAHIILIVAIVTVVCTAALHIHSYWWSESLTVRDVTIAVDEGLVSLNVPLVMLAENERPQWDFMLFKRGPISWTTPGPAGKAPLRNWMSSLDKREEAAMFGDFGYWKGGWQSKSRPGPFLLVFVPVRLIGVIAFCVGLIAIRAGVTRFSLRTLVIAFTLVAVVFGVAVMMLMGS